MSAQALSHWTLRRTRLLYMLMRKITSRARMPRIIRPVIEYLVGGGVRQLPIRPIYVGAGLGVKQAWARACSTWSGKGPKLGVGIVLIVYYPGASLAMLFKTQSAAV